MVEDLADTEPTLQQPRTFILLRDALVLRPDRKTRFRPTKSTTKNRLPE